MLGNFIEESRRLALDKPGTGIAEAYGAVQRAQRVLQHANAKVRLDFDNLEALLCSLEMAEVLGGLSAFDEAAVNETRTQLLRLISLTLDHSQQMRVQWSTPGTARLIASGPSDHAALAGFINSLRSCKYKHYVSVLTFNYDVGLEVALKSHGVAYDYCLSPRDTTTLLPVDKMPVALCKLHGSLSWVKLARDDSPSILHFDPCEELHKQAYGKVSSPGQCFLDTSHGRSRLSGSHPNDSLPFIVPPGDAKSGYRNSVRHVWKTAKDVLSCAEVIYVSGYSLPSTDTFFHQMFGLGMMSDTVVRRVVINNIDQGAIDRMSALFGPVIANRAGVLHPWKSNLIQWLQSESEMLRRAQFYL